MGKPYDSEMLKLSDTYEWAKKVPIEGFVSFVEESLSLPLISVGSGGSFTAAYLASLLHQEKGHLSKAVTPLELYHCGKILLDSSVLVLTAKGANTDILSAFKFAVAAEPKQLMTLCMRKQSPITSFTKQFNCAYILDYEPPAGEDGFLATNSLLAFATILVRAYGAIRTNVTLPENLSLPTDWIERDKVYYQKLSGASTYVVLYGYWGAPKL
jgi:fructoselysine-6-P-deglycase FrlB-like protein